jgi:RES domain-containing protein
MQVWRLARSVYPALDGEGARRYGGRWNAPGTPVVYTAESLSLSALELLVHLNPAQLPGDLMAYAIDIPDELAVQCIGLEDLPDGWHRRAEDARLRRLGQAWADAERGPDPGAPVLKVPSAVIPEERNVLINPRHPDASEVTVSRKRPFTFDPRLLE